MCPENPSPAVENSARRYTPAAELTDAGMSPVVAAELERRIELVAAEEAERDPSRQPMSTAELAQYVFVAVGCCVIGLVVMFL
ncbi:hypothetical protein [Kocuria sp. SM24M-10]|uniref:hypothetical protein n=1 Tax=Kocuria sp. SM24M-10 TaxID=1660349 RepID=UPI00064A7EF1|nr:hypothetical protein [Kocuria sp. SM24M-10]KLU10956.1 hypothetical protein ABL57_03845 [Kocuria sp. SM24M-10]